MRALALALLFAVLSTPSARLQSSRDSVTAEQVRAAIDKLGSLEFPVRTGAARTVRRAEAAVAVPALLAAVERHGDEYVRFRALVILSGFNDPRTAAVMRKALAERNDRMRTVAYAYFEHHPDPSVAPLLLEALDREESEFVRPALTRALRESDAIAIAYAHGKPSPGYWLWSRSLCFLIIWPLAHRC